MRPSRDPQPIDPGTPGASARREYERRQAKREARIRERHPKLGGLILAVTDAPAKSDWVRSSTSSLPTPSESCTTGASLAPAANIDHIAVTPTGVYVIDPKRYNGRPTLKVEGGILRPRTEKLIVGNRDRTKLVDGVLRQVDLVRSIVGDEVHVTGGSL